MVKGFAVPINLQNSLLYAGGSVFAACSFLLLPEAQPKAFFEGYTPLAALLVLFQATRLVYCRLPTADYLLPATYYRLPTADYLLLTTCCLLHSPPTTYSLPTA